MPSRRFLAFALALAFAAGGFGLARASGWEPRGPPVLPVSTPSPDATSPLDYDGLRDSEEIEVEGARFVVELLGPAEVRGEGAYFSARIARTGGDGGRVWPSLLALRDADGRLLSQVDSGWPARDGVGAVLSASLSPGNQTVALEVVLSTYRDIAWGAWRGEDLVVRLDARVSAAPAA